MTCLKNKRVIFLIFATIFLLFFSKNNLMYIRQPIKVSYGVILIGILLVLFLDIIISKKLIISPTLRLLMILAIYSLVQYLVLGAYSDRAFGMFSTLFPLIVIFWCSVNKNKFDKHNLLKLFLITCTVIISVQTIVTIFVVNKSNTGEQKLTSSLADKYIANIDLEKNPDIKKYIKDNKLSKSENDLHDKLANIKRYNEKDKYQIPLGGSNYIAAILVVLIGALLLIKGLNIYLRYGLVSLGVIAIFISKSFGGILSLIFVILAAIYLKNIFNIQKYKKIVFIFVGVMIAFSIYVIFMLMINPENALIRKLDVLLTHRLTIYRNTIYYIMQKPILGYGFVFDAWMSKPHNIILSVVSISGCIGLVIISTIFFKFYKRGNNVVKIVILATVVQGMIEPNLFNAIFDFIFWMIIALSINYSEDEGFSLKKLNISSIIIKCVIISLLSVAWLNFGRVMSTSYSDIPIDNFKLEDIKPELKDEVKSQFSRNLLEKFNNKGAIYKEIKTKFDIPLNVEYPNNKIYITYNDDKKSFELREIYIKNSKIKDITEFLISKINKEYPRFELGKPTYNIYKDKVDIKRIIFIIGSIFALTILIEIWEKINEGNYLSRRKWDKTLSNN